MGKGRRSILKLTSLFFRLRNTTLSSSQPTSWPCTPCMNPRTHSFHAFNHEDQEDVPKSPMNNSIYHDSNSTYSCFTNTSEDNSESFSTMSENQWEESLEAAIHALKSKRLFFRPGISTSLILEKTIGDEEARRFSEESITMVMNSNDPVRDFRTSMEEMMVAHVIEDWKSFGELLLWYLDVNEIGTHGFILEAFFELVVSFDSSFPSCSCVSYPTQTP